MLRWYTAGESHGEKLIGMLEGMPSGVPVPLARLEHMLKKRRIVYGRSSRSIRENDSVKILSGIRDGKTTGSPIALEILNSARDTSVEKPTVVRPGHADLAGSLKYRQKDTRNVIERASARETAARTALFVIASELIYPFGVRVHSLLTRLGAVRTPFDYYHQSQHLRFHAIENSPLRAVDESTERLMSEEVDRMKLQGDSPDGEVQVIASGIPLGLGSYTSWDRRLDTKLGMAIFSIPSVKGLCIGRNIFSEMHTGSEYHDIPICGEKRFFHQSNNAGGIEGGVSNGEEIVLHIAVKPIPTLLKKMPSVDLVSGESVEAYYERSDITQLPAICTVLESAVFFVLSNEVLLQCGGDTWEEFSHRFEVWRSEVKQ